MDEVETAKAASGGETTRGGRLRESRSRGSETGHASPVPEFAAKVAEPEQPLVFFREGWEFRWLSGRQVLARSGLAEPGRTIVDERGDFEEPPELSEFLREVEAMLRHGGSGPRSTPHVSDVVLEVRRALRRRQRPTMVLPSADLAELRFLLWLGLELGAAFVLPPDPSTFAWSVRTMRPSVVIAGDSLLLELAEELRARSNWSRRRTVSATRCVFALGAAGEDNDALGELAPLMRAGTPMRRIVLQQPA